jgi:hypothetical protein
MRYRLLTFLDVSDGELEQAGGFGLSSLAVEDGLHHLEDITLTLAHLHTVLALSPRSSRAPRDLNEGTLLSG